MCSQDKRDYSNISTENLINRLFLKSSEIEDIGLYHGKCGIALSMLHYSKITGNFIYSEFAYELIKEIYNDIHKISSWNFEYGISGIGWAFIQMLKEGFVTGNPNEILEDVDKQIMMINLHKVTDKSLQSGLRGILVYVDSRIEISTIKNEELPFDKSYIDDYLFYKKHYSITQYDVYKTLFNNASCTTKKLGLFDGIAGIIFNHEFYEEHFPCK